MATVQELQNAIDLKKLDVTQLNDQQNMRYKKFQELFDGENEDVLDQIKKKSELILLNDSLKDN